MAETDAEVIPEARTEASNSDATESSVAGDVVGSYGITFNADAMQIIDGYVQRTGRPDLWQGSFVWAASVGVLNHRVENPNSTGKMTAGELDAVRASAFHKFQQFLPHDKRDLTGEGWRNAG